MAHTAPTARLTWTRRLATLGAVATLPVALSVGTTPAQGLTPADGERAAKTHLVTFKAPGCEGCRVRVYNARWDDTEEHGVAVWQSKGKKVVDGKVTFAVPAGLTRGLSASVAAPWEGHTGYVTTVAFKYGGTETGEVITVEEARDKQRASACWAGSDARRTTIRLVTQQVTVGGVTGPAQGTLAFARVTQQAMVPMRAAHDGVLGSQDVNICGKR